ncbi:unnamed protein product [Symbiodinium sp. CCMP2456]|nr:unnamed protein product [Symbiodinium sp. CCMP2456]
MADGRRRRVLVLSGWSPGPLDVLRNRMPDVEFLEPTIPMPPSGCRWCLNPFCLLLLVVIFWLTPEAASNDKLVAQVDESFAWLVRLALLLAIPVLLRLVVAGLVWFAIKDGLWTTSRAIRDFQPDVLLGFSWGGGVALWLLSQGRWKGPTLLLAPTVNAMSWAAQQHINKKKKSKRDIGPRFYVQASDEQLSTQHQKLACPGQLLLSAQVGLQGFYRMAKSYA